MFRHTRLVWVLILTLGSSASAQARARLTYLPTEQPLRYLRVVQIRSFASNGTVMRMKRATFDLEVAQHDAGGELLTEIHATPKGEEDPERPGASADVPTISLTLLTSAGRILEGDRVVQSVLGLEFPGEGGPLVTWTLPLEDGVNKITREFRYTGEREEAGSTCITVLETRKRPTSESSAADVLEDRACHVFSPDLGRLVRTVRLVRRFRSRPEGARLLIAERREEVRWIREVDQPTAAPAD